MKPAPAPIEVRDPKQVEYDDSCDCKPRYCCSSMAILRWVEVILGVTVCALVSTTCSRGVCINMTNQFGSTTQGQAYVLLAAAVAIVMTLVLLMVYTLNIHRAMGACVSGMERAFVVFSILLFITLSGVESYYASIAHNPDLAKMGRTVHGIQPQWIAAAVMGWIATAVYIVDLVFQTRPGYPNQYVLV